MMQPRFASLSLLTLCLVAVPAGTQTPTAPKSPTTVTLYTNGPINGDTNAWTINHGFIVTDNMSIQNVQPYAYVTAISFGAWLFPGACYTCSLSDFDYVSSVQVQIGTSPYGYDIFDGVVTSWVATDCNSNAYGYTICVETADFRGPELATPGVYWLTMQNAVVSRSGIANTDPVFWDENSGPSLAMENQTGTIPSESFTVLGYYSSSALDPAAGAPNGKNPSGTSAPRPSALSSSGR